MSYNKNFILNFLFILNTKCSFFSLLPLLPFPQPIFIHYLWWANPQRQRNSAHNNLKQDFFLKWNFLFKYSKNMFCSRCSEIVLFHCCQRNPHLYLLHFRSCVNHYSKLLGFFFPFPSKLLLLIYKIVRIFSMWLSLQ